MAENAEVRIELEGSEEFRQAIARCKESLKIFRAEIGHTSSDIDKLVSSFRILNDTMESGEKSYQGINSVSQTWQQGLSSTQVQIVQVNQELNANIAYLQKADSITNQFTKNMEELGKKSSGIKGIREQFSMLITDFANNSVKRGLDALKESVSVFMEMEDAQNQLQASTGATAAQMERYKEVMEEVYASNYGKSFSDIADAAGAAIQVLGQMNAGSLKEVTQSAIVLRDTFGMDYQEQLQAIKNLMQNFGITSKQAYNLVVQGAQQGLNQNGELLNTINEYSGHYAQMGVSAEGFFNSLSNGTKAGTLSVDKLGGAYKEFGIRVQDTAGSATEGFRLLGLNADGMREKFAAGGESAAEATAEVLDALYNMDDAVAQNQAGVNLFGTMWEELGIQGVRALMDVNGEISSAKSSMSDLQEIKYDGLSNQLEEIGRIFQSEIMAPVLEEFLPVAEAGIDILIFGIKNVVPIVTTAAAAVTGYTIATKGMTIVIEAAEIAQKALNAAQSMSGLGLISAAVGVAVVGLCNYALNAGEASEEVKKLAERNDDLVQSANQVASSVEKLVDGYADSSEEMEVQGKYTEILSERISELASQQNRSSAETYILKGYIEELNELVPDLNLAFDDQTGLLNMTSDAMEAYIANNQELVAFQSAMEYRNELIQKQTELEIEAARITEAGNVLQKEQDELLTEYGYIITNAFGALVVGLSDERKSYQALTEEQEKNREALSNNKAAMEEVAAQIAGADEYIKEHADIVGAATAKTEEHTAAMGEEAGMASSTSQQLSESTQKIVDTYTGMRDTISGVLEDQMNMFEQFNGGVQLSSEEMLNNMQSQIDGVSNWADNMGLLADRGINQNLLTYLQELGPKGAGYVETFAQMSDEELQRASAMWQESMDMKSGIQENVQGMLTKYTEALNGGKEEVNAAMREVGAYSVEGLVEALENGEELVRISGSQMAENVPSSVVSVLQISSPSKVMEQIGVYAGEGLILGLQGKEGAVQEAAGSVASTLVNNLKDNLDSKQFINMGETIAYGVSVGLENKNEDLGTAVQGMTDQVRGIISENLKMIHFNKVGQNVPSGLINGIRNGRLQAATVAAALAAAVKENAEKIGSLYSAGLNVAYGLASGIRDGKSSIINAVAAMCQAAVSEAYYRLSIHSPSKVFQQIGSYTAQGFGVGYEQEMDEVNQMIARSMDYSDLTPRVGRSAERTDAGLDQHITIELPIYTGKQYSRTEIVEIALDGIGRRQRNQYAMKGEMVYV